MSSRNAELLYAYGRCLYHVAVKNSDVLGSKVAGEREDESKKSHSKKLKMAQVAEAPNGRETNAVEEVVAKVVEEEDKSIRTENESEKTNRQSLFQFTGDENWDSSEEENINDQDDDDAVDADEEDDFVNAYEVLDLARVLLLKRLNESEKLHGEEQTASQDFSQLKELLADTYDLQAEISLEGERFPAAVMDLRSALELKADLFPQDSSILAEAHYKLSLALEFSSVTQEKGVNGELKPGKEAQLDEATREAAAMEMEAAIVCCKLRIEKEQTNRSVNAQDEGHFERPKITKTDIEDVKEMTKEMEQRVSRDVP